MNAILHDLADKRALDDLIYRQALAVDKHDWATYRKCLANGEVHFDFTDHTDRVVGKHIGVETSADRWVEKVISVNAGFEGSQHSISNAIHAINGDAGESECMVVADHFLSNNRGSRSFTMGGIYTFSTVRTPDGWKIRRWLLKILWYRGNPTLYELAAEKVRAGATR
jgi:hypothetical protein